MVLRLYIWNWLCKPLKRNLVGEKMLGLIESWNRKNHTVFSIKYMQELAGHYISYLEYTNFGQNSSGTVGLIDEVFDVLIVILGFQLQNWLGFGPWKQPVGAKCTILGLYPTHLSKGPTCRISNKSWHSHWT